MPPPSLPHLFLPLFPLSPPLPPLVPPARRLATRQLMGALESALHENMPDTCALKDTCAPKDTCHQRPRLAGACCRGDILEDGVVTDMMDMEGVRIAHSSPACFLTDERWSSLDAGIDPGDLLPLKVWSTSAGARGPDDNLPATWRRRLCQGAIMALDGEPVRVLLDTELGCLEVREHEALYPLAELRMCSELPHKSHDLDTAYELTITFGELEALLFQFDEEEERAGFRAALDALAVEARGGHFPDDGPDASDASAIVQVLVRDLMP